MGRADPSGRTEKCWYGEEMLRSMLNAGRYESGRGRIWNAPTDFSTAPTRSRPAAGGWTVHD